MKKQYVTLTVNGREYRFSIGDGFGQVPPSETQMCIRDREGRRIWIPGPPLLLQRLCTGCRCIRLRG